VIRDLDIMFIGGIISSLIRALLLAIAAVLVAAPVPGLAAAERVPSFDEVLVSKDAKALTDWAQRYEHGVGVEQHTGRAVRLYCKAAERGDMDAKFQLGQIYAFGRGIERDRDLAVAWFQAAARGKDPKAAGMLRLLKAEGKPKLTAACPPEGVRTWVAGRPHPARGPIAELVRGLAPKYGLDANLVLAVVEAESGFNPQAKSPKNAQGLMQLIPATAERFGVGDVWDTEQNLRGGMAYLQWLLKYFQGDVELALAGYNAGEGAVTRYGGVPPYAETRGYVSRIIARLN
jgi:TPR repeat protein